jgi:hypothetical protein
MSTMVRTINPRHLGDDGRRRASCSVAPGLPAREFYVTYHQLMIVSHGSLHCLNGEVNAFKASSSARDGVDAAGERLDVSGLKIRDASERSGGACASAFAIARADSSPERNAPCRKPEYRSWNASPAKWIGPTGARSLAWPDWSALGGIACARTGITRGVGCIRSACTAESCKRRGVVRRLLGCIPRKRP